jgi:hypothetical protein
VNGAYLAAPFVDAGVNVNNTPHTLYVLNGLNSSFVSDIDLLVDGNHATIVDVPFFSDSPAKFEIRNSLSEVIMSGTDLLLTANSTTISLSRRSYDAVLSPNQDIPSAQNFVLGHIPLTVDGDNTIEIYAYTNTLPVSGSNPSAAKKVKFYLKRKGLSLIVNPPTGVKTLRYRDRVDVVNVENPVEEKIIGYNYYHSLEPAGGLDGYTRLNNLPISVPFSFEEFKKKLVEEVDEVDGVRTTKIIEQVEVKNLYSFPLFCDYRSWF